MNELSRLPTSQDYMQSIHNAFSILPTACGASASASFGKEGKDDSITVSSNHTNFVNVEANASQPEAFRSYDVFGVGIEVYGKSWHSITGIGAKARPGNNSGISG